jgi:ubiquinone/menaquinone biosynthesis C-methylase UbiE
MGKEKVKEFWNEASCGENLYLKGGSKYEKYINQMSKRYELEAFILPFADFENQHNKKVLEVGVGLGADHQKFAENGAVLSGCDLTERAIEMTKNRFKLFNLSSELRVADAENLPYAENTFDTVYSWGVIHHTPNTPKAIQEIYRVLKKNGVGKIMIYHKKSIVGYMLWIRYGLMKLKPFRTLNFIYSNYLESSGTKAYTVTEAYELFKKFSSIKVETILCHGDLLTSQAGQRHEGSLLNIARKIYPRWIIKNLFPKKGLFMLIEVKK